MSDDNNDLPGDITTEVSILDLEPKFTGNYSDVYVGRFRGQLVGAHRLVGMQTRN
jgi:hypothetical protein